MLNHRSSDLGIPGESQHLSGLVLLMFESGPSVWTGRALQAKNDDPEMIGLALLYPALDGTFEFLAIMDIRARL